MARDYYFCVVQIIIMAVYRFRAVFEDNEDVIREIEIQGKQTYLQLHAAIQEAIGFDSSKEASFFMSDDYWRKGTEITTRNLSNSDDDDDDDYRRPQKKNPVKAAKDTRIADMIDDPHQKLIYVFDPAAKWTLLIELIRIVQDEPKTVYPRTVKSSGAAPKQYKVVVAPPVDEDDDEEDEEDKKAREKLFVAEEEYDENAAEGAEEDEGGTETEEASEESEDEGEEGGEDEGGQYESEQDDY
jgi:hypothetical protein